MQTFSYILAFFPTELGPVCAKRPSHGSGLLPERLPVSTETEVSSSQSLGVCFVKFSFLSHHFCNCKLDTQMCNFQPLKSRHIPLYHTSVGDFSGSFCFI